MGQHRLLQLDAIGLLEQHRVRDHDDGDFLLLEQFLDTGLEPGRFLILAVVAHRHDVTGAATVLEEQPQRVVEQVVPALLAFRLFQQVAAGADIEVGLHRRIGVLDDVEQRIGPGAVVLVVLPHGTDAPGLVQQ